MVIQCIFYPSQSILSCYLCKLSETKEKLSESENKITQLSLENKQPTIIINQNDKKPTDFSFLELFIAIIKKIFKSWKQTNIIQITFQIRKYEMCFILSHPITPQPHTAQAGFPF